MTLCTYHQLVEIRQIKKWRKKGATKPYNILFSGFTSNVDSFMELPKNFAC